MTLPITNTITATASDHFRAETPGGALESSSLRDLGDRLRNFLANLEHEAGHEGATAPVSPSLGSKS